MWELDYKESWIPKIWCFWTVVLEKTLESPLDCKEIQPIHPKGNQSWIFTGRTDVEAETPILWPPDVKNWLTGKDPDAGKDWRSEEKGTTEDEMVGCHHWLSGRESGETLGAGDGQRGLACCSPWGCKKSDMTERLNWTELNHRMVKEFPRECSLYVSTRWGMKCWWHRESNRSCNFHKRKCNKQEGSFFLELDNINMHFHNSSQPGAGDTLTNCSGALRTNDIYLFAWDF